jgi:hypothetical protein
LYSNLFKIFTIIKLGHVSFRKITLLTVKECKELTSHCFTEQNSIVPQAFKGYLKPLFLTVNVWVVEERFNKRCSCMQAQHTVGQEGPLAVILGIKDVLPPKRTSIACICLRYVDRVRI